MGPGLVTQPLSQEQWAVLDRINDALMKEYSVRRQMLLTRCDVTVQSFKWSERAKVSEKGREGRREGGKEGRREGREGRREGGKGEREGGKGGREGGREGGKGEREGGKGEREGEGRRLIHFFAMLLAGQG